MDDKYRKLSAYERRKINSQKIAQVQFEPSHKSPEQAYNYVKKKHEQFKEETEKFWDKTKKPEGWTSVDQKKEEELWDE